MADDLGARLVQAGLVTPEQLAEVRGTAPPHEGALLAGLIRRGLSEDAAAGFFVAAGLGPVMDDEDLRGADPSARGRVPGRMARELLAMPVRESPAGLIVAMAAPTDRHALAELRRAVKGEILPTAARVTQLQSALARAYPGAPSTALVDRPESEPPVLELVPSRRKPSAPDLDVDSLAATLPPLAADDDEAVLPLVRHKPLGVPVSASRPASKPKVITRSFEKPSERELAEAREALSRSTPPPIWNGPRISSRPPISSSPRISSSAPISSTPPKSIIPIDHARWDVEGGADAPENEVDPGKLRRISASPKRAERPSPVGGTLAAIRASRDKGEVVELACRGALTVCRASILLALKKNVLKGWDGAGAGLTREAVRNVWIPTNSPSMFRDVVGRGEPYVGAHGTSAADGLFRAAVGSRGGEVVLMPISVGGKVVAVMAADDVAFGREGEERVEILARAVGEAFERIIVESKRR